MTQTAMCWGISCGDGWFDIIYQACEEIEAYLQEQENKGIRVMSISDWHNIKTNEGVDESAILYYPEFTQIKEKFGSLRMYYVGGDDVIDKILEKAETLSETTCESCGSDQGKVQGKGWIRILCDSCEENRFKNN